MRTDRPKVSPSVRYTQKQAAAALHIDRHTLKRYTDRGLIGCSEKLTGGAKLYRGADILRLWRELYHS